MYTIQHYTIVYSLLFYLMETKFERKAAKVSAPLRTRPANSTLHFSRPCHDTGQRWHYSNRLGHRIGKLRRSLF